MAATKKKQSKASTAKRGSSRAVKRTKRAVTRRAAGKSIVERRKFKAAKPTEDTPLPEPIATFTF